MSLLARTPVRQLAVRRFAAPVRNMHGEYKVRDFTTTRFVKRTNVACLVCSTSRSSIQIRRHGEASLPHTSSLVSPSHSLPHGTKCTRLLVTLRAPGADMSLPVVRAPALTEHLWRHCISTHRLRPGSGLDIGSTLYRRGRIRVMRLNLDFTFTPYPPWTC